MQGRCGGDENEEGDTAEYECGPRAQVDAAGCPIKHLSSATDGDEADAGLGFRLGADAYVLEPYGILEMLARIGALVRRFRGLLHSPPIRDDTLTFGDIVLNERHGIVSKGGAPVALSPKEFGVLVALARRSGAAVRRADLLREVWGDGFSETSRTVDVHIGELRRKLEDDASRPRYILTEWKVGYPMASELTRTPK